MPAHKTACTPCRRQKKKCLPLGPDANGCMSCFSSHRECDRDSALDPPSSTEHDPRPHRSTTNSAPNTPPPLKRRRSLSSTDSAHKLASRSKKLPRRRLFQREVDAEAASPGESAADIGRRVRAAVALSQITQGQQQVAQGVRELEHAPQVRDMSADQRVRIAVAMARITQGRELVTNGLHELAPLLSVPSSPSWKPQGSASRSNGTPRLPSVPPLMSPFDLENSDDTTFIRGSAPLQDSFPWEDGQDCASLVVLRGSAAPHDTHGNANAADDLYYPSSAAYLSNTASVGQGEPTPFQPPTSGLSSSASQVAPSFVEDDFGNLSADTMDAILQQCLPCEEVDSNRQVGAFHPSSSPSPFPGF